MTDPYKTAFNIQNGIAIEPHSVEEMAAELQKLKQNWNEQERSINELKKDLGKAVIEASDLEEQTNLYVYTGAKKAYMSVMDQIDNLGI